MQIYLWLNFLFRLSIALCGDLSPGAWLVVDDVHVEEKGRYSILFFLALTKVG